MSGHTPGPWEVCGHDVRGPYAMGDSERPGLHVCTVAGGDKANARLIAAAPEMLDLLVKLRDAGSWYSSALEIDVYRKDAPDGEELEAELIALIAKATGEQP